MIPLAAGTIVTFNRILWISGGTAISGLAMAWFVSALLRIVHSPRRTGDQSWQFEERRRSRLRKGSSLYRWLEPLIDELASVKLLHRLGGRNALARSLERGAPPLPWKAEEYIAVNFFLGIVVAGSAGFMLSCMLGLPMAAVFGVSLGTFSFVISIKNVHKAAGQRLAELKMRLPFAIDLIALMLEAGAGLRDGLRAVVQEYREHPLGQEFGRVLQALSRGQPLRDALLQMQRRLHDEDINEIVLAVLNAEELGAKRSKTFLTLADQMRLRRSQRAEKAAGQAQAMITFPGLVIMIACLLVVGTPFILSAYFA